MSKQDFLQMAFIKQNFDEEITDLTCNLLLKSSSTTKNRITNKESEQMYLTLLDINDQENYEKFEQTYLEFTYNRLEFNSNVEKLFRQTNIEIKKEAIISNKYIDLLNDQIKSLEMKEIEFTEKESQLKTKKEQLELLFENQKKEL
ncbi:unnamed protein product [Brachionus calyciflorus]|uniref:Uncharacterized protein n=1 Tax=Brachionus calyciflorus TaxID=104777 RepID=A0A814LSQ1_9BILA|nr:unnamed protein product [Brachionus calyciflorus]